MINYAFSSFQSAEMNIKQNTNSRCTRNDNINIIYAFYRNLYIYAIGGRWMQMYIRYVAHRSLGYTTDATRGICLRLWLYSLTCSLWILLRWPYMLTALTVRERRSAFNFFFHTITGSQHVLFFSLCAYMLFMAHNIII